MKSKLILMMLAMLLTASAQTNKPVIRQPVQLNQHQAFYTNWCRAYFPARDALAKQLPSFYRQKEVARKELTGAESAKNRAIKARIKASDDALAPYRARYDALIKQRLVYEANNTRAIDFAPRIPNWQKFPSVDMKD